MTPKDLVVQYQKTPSKTPSSCTKLLWRRNVFFLFQTFFVKGKVRGCWTVSHGHGNLYLLLLGWFILFYTPWEPISYKIRSSLAAKLGDTKPFFVWEKIRKAELCYCLCKIKGLDLKNRSLFRNESIGVKLASALMIFGIGCYWTNIWFALSVLTSRKICTIESSNTEKPLGTETNHH